MRLDLEGRVARVTLDDPPVNAIGGAWLDTFESILERISVPDSCSVLHVRSDLRVFCAGADLDEMRRRLAAADGVDAMVATAARMQQLFGRIERLPVVTLAEIGGAALGGGFELALACDLRIMAAEAKVGLPEARLGLVPGAGGTQRLTRIAGRAQAARLVLGAEVVDGATAAALGMVQWVVARADLAARASELATAIARLPVRALAACKSCLAAAGDPQRDGYAEELAASRALYDDPETRARIAAFLRGDR